MRKAMFQLKDKIKIQMLDKSKTTGVPNQCLEGYMNSNVWKDEIINTMFGRIQARIPKFGGARSVFECFKGKGQNSKVWKCIFNVWKDKARIPKFGCVR